MKTPQEALEYLRDMEKIKDKDQFKPDEIEEIHNCLRQNVKASNTNEALDLSASIAEAQVQNFGTDVDMLLDTILYEGGNKGAEQATYKATSAKLSLAAKFIDSEQYDKFESMSFEHMDKDFFVEKDPEMEEIMEYNTKGIDNISSAIMQRVRTLKGAQYMVDNGKIQNEYFTNDYMGALNTASLEQLDFFVKQGANINAGAAMVMPYGELSEDFTLLDFYTQEDTPESLAYMKEIIRLGGRREDYCYISDYLHNNENISSLFAKKLMLLNDSDMLSASEQNTLRRIMDPLQFKIDILREKIGDKLGKTDKYSKEEAKTHIDTAKQVMQMGHPKRGGMGE